MNVIPSGINCGHYLIGVYFSLEPGLHIALPDERLYLSTIDTHLHSDHPHAGLKIYITRRSLKHFVEKRKSDLGVRHSDDEILAKLRFALHAACSSVIKYDLYEPSPPRHLYAKIHGYEQALVLRVIVEETADAALEVCSIHFRKRSAHSKSTTR